VRWRTDRAEFLGEDGAGREYWLLGGRVYAEGDARTPSACWPVGAACARFAPPSGFPRGREEEQVDDSVRYTPTETWRLEFQSFRGAPHKKKPIDLRDGTTVEVGTRYDGAGYYVTEGKQRHHSTVSLYMCAGLDGIESVRKDARDERVVIVADRHGAVAAYHLGRRVAADSSGERAKTSAQMGAVMAGERLASEGAREVLRGQYLISYDEYMAERTARKLLKATDAFYALAKKEEINPGFADDDLAVLANDAGGPSPTRRRLEQGVLARGPALVEDLLAIVGSGALPSEEELSRLLARVRSFAEDVAGYERLVAGDLACARADLELARRAALRLLVGEDGAA
jgi:hypothetical protein